ncbi:MAG: hypothetical protein HY569_01190 [Candidatus Magasanikbacteria bacterium]|nr:hypothetical protein [Candidatus Magasanikbacteria bacterium]
METFSGGLMLAISKFALGLGEFFIKMSIFFLRFFIALAQYNNYIDSPVVKLGWLMVRDVVNMFFVVILLVIAIGTILGMEQYQWNKTLVKLILSAVFVNFSNLISQLFIDAAHIFTLTFASAISATAGGNLINMFHFEKIYAITTGKVDVGVKGESFDMMGRTLVASIVAMLFALLAMLVMGAYAIMMLLRMTVLWVLIILSPMAFLFIALPQTTNRYGEWWKEFSNYVVLAPTISFFMWLAFATAGSGTLGSDIGITDSMLQSGQIDSVGALTLSAVTTWENMANFLVAIVLLFVGLQEVQKLNVAGGSVASKAKDFFGKVATIATGYAAGRWLAGKAAAGAKAGVGLAWKGTKTAAWYGVRGQQWKEWGQYQYASFQAWRKNTRRQPKLKTDEKGELIRVDGKVVWDTDEQGRVIMEEAPPEGIKSGIQHWLNKRVQADDFSAKRLKKMQDFEKKREELNSRYISANPSHKFFMDEAERNSVMEMRDENGEVMKDEKGKTKYIRTDIARFESGIEEFNKARSNDKTKEHAAMGQAAAGAAERYKLTGTEGKIPVLTIVVKKKEDETSINEQRAGHQIRSEFWETAMTNGLEKAKLDYASSEEGRQFLVNKDDLRLSTEAAKDNFVAIEKEIEEEALGEGRKEYEEMTARIEEEQKKLLSGKEVSLSAELTGIEDQIDEKQQKLSSPLMESADAARDEYLAKRKGLENNRSVVDKEAVEEMGKLSEDERKSMDERVSIENEINNAEKMLGEAKTQKEKSVASADVEGWKQVLADFDEKYKGTTLGAFLEKAKAHDVIEEKISTLDAEYNMEKLRREQEIERVVTTDPELQRLREERKTKEKALKEAGTKYQQTDEYKTKKAEVDSRIEEIERGMSTAGAERIKAKITRQTSEAAAKRAEEQAMRAAMGVNGLRKLFEAAQVEEILTDAAKKFVDEIKQVKLKDLFEKSLNNIKQFGKQERQLKDVERKEKMEEDPAKKAEQRAQMDGLRKELKGLREDMEAQAGIQMVTANVRQKYTQEATGIAKGELEDEADTVYTQERYGYDSPATAFKALIKKKMDEFQGVEREQSVEMAMGSLAHLVSLRKAGERLSRDQEAMLMAGVTYLTKQAWSDDLLDRMAKKTRRLRSGGLQGEERKKMEAIEDLMINELHWGSVDKDTGQWKIVNQSDNRRTNDLHRLIAYGGDSELLGAENAVLKQMNVTGLGYGAAAEKIAKEVQAAFAGKEINVSAPEFSSVAKKLGFDPSVERDLKQLQNFVSKFVVGAKDAKDSVGRFKDSVKDHFEANQMLADAKNLAMAVGHLDDGGHTFYDQNEGVFRGMTPEAAMQFILSDWRKVGSDERMKKLKVHTIAQMNEDTGTIAIDARNRDAIRETFLNVDTELNFNKMDGRTVDQVAGLAAGEAAFIDPTTGRMVLGHKNSKMQSGTFGYIEDAGKREEAALIQLADNFAVFLNEAPTILAASLGKRSNVGFDQSVTGVFNCQLPNGKVINNVDDIIDFVETYQRRKEDPKERIDLNNKMQIKKAFTKRQSQPRKKKKEGEEE